MGEGDEEVGVGVGAVPVEVDVVIAAAAILLYAAMVAAAVRPARLAAWYPEAVVRPAATARVQYVLAAVVSTALLVVNTKAALAVPLPLKKASHVPLPQVPVLVTANLVAIPVMLGSTNVILSHAANATSAANLKDTEEAVEAVVVAMVSWDVVIVGKTTAVDVVIAAAAAFPAAAVKATVRVFRLAACTAAGLVTPVATVTVHAPYATSVAVAAVNVSVAVDVPELALATVQVVVPQSVLVTEARVPNVKLGSTRANVSAAAMALE